MESLEQKQQRNKITKLRENLSKIERETPCKVAFDIDVDMLEIYVNGWYLGDISLKHITAEARYEIGLDLNYNDSDNDGGKESRPDRE